MAFRNPELPRLQVLLVALSDAWSAGSSHSLAPSHFLSSSVPLLELVVMGAFMKKIPIVGCKASGGYFFSPSKDETLRLRDPPSVL